MRNPDLIIFKLDELTEDGDQAFCQVSVLDGKVVNDSVKVFAVLPGDDYLQLRFDQVVFAESNEVGSTELARFSIMNNETEEPTKIYEMGAIEMNKILPTLVSEVVKLKN